MARVKGTGVIPLVRFLRRSREQALEILPPKLSEYLEKRILESSWYPAEDHLHLIRAAVEIAGGDRQQTLREFGRVAAREHLSGIYAHLNVEEDPLAIPRRAFALWSSQHDTGKLSVKLHGDREATVRIDGFGGPSEEICAITAAYIEEVLSQSELGKPRLDKRACQNRGADACEWAVRWR